MNQNTGTISQNGGKTSGTSEYDVSEQNGPR